MAERDVVTVPRKRYDLVRKAADEAFDAERKYFAEHDQYDHPEIVNDYISVIESEDPKKAARMWYDAADASLKVEIPDPKVIKAAIEHLKGLGHQEDSIEIFNRFETKKKKLKDVVYKSTGWGETKQMIRRSLAERVTGVIFILSILGIIGLFYGSITGHVISVGDTVAPKYGIVLAFIALITGLRLLLIRKNK